jgi:HEAT repeat protein
MEPVWGGQEDTAAPLRGSCALALIQCADLRRSAILRHVLDALTDRADSVRIDAARALEQLEGDDAALLLRLKARLGDENPRVTGQTMESLLTIEAEQAVPFVSGFLESKKGEIFEEAALALGASRLPQALEALQKAWQCERNRPRGDAILGLIAASRRPDGIEFLVSLIREGSDRDASVAAKALEVHREAAEIQKQVKEALRARRK